MRNLIILLLLIPSALYALEKKDVEAKLGVKLKELNKSPVKGLYEIVTGNNKIYYIDETARYLVEGVIGDLDKRVSITRQRLDELTKIDFNTLPLNDAIKSGSGKRKLAIFHDPDCPYCKRLYSEVKKLKDVTIYNFLFNLPSHPGAYNKAKKVYCSKEPLKAMDVAMTGGDMGSFKLCDTGVVDRNTSLSAKVGVSGTPHMILENGVPLRGFRTAAFLEKKLSEVSRK